MTTLIDALKGLLSEMDEQISQTTDDFVTGSWRQRLSLIIAEHERSGDWQPIDDSLSDDDKMGCLVSCHDEQGPPIVGEAQFLGEDGWYWAHNDPLDEWGGPIYPTHWQPLPKGPKNA